jgi:hypothetical protein
MRIGENTNTSSRSAAAGYGSEILSGCGALTIDYQTKSRPEMDSRCQFFVGFTIR